jgi:hypothetical protein
MNSRKIARPLRAVALVLCTLAPQVSWASGDMSGAYVSFFLAPLLAIWVAGNLFFRLSGDIYRRIGLAMISVPVSLIAYLALCLLVGMLEEKPGEEIWPSMVAAFLIALAPLIFLGRNSSESQEANGNGEP